MADAGLEQKPEVHGALLKEVECCAGKNKIQLVRFANIDIYFNNVFVQKKLIIVVSRATGLVRAFFNEN